MPKKETREDGKEEGGRETNLLDGQILCSAIVELLLALGDALCHERDGENEDGDPCDEPAEKVGPEESCWEEGKVKEKRIAIKQDLDVLEHEVELLFEARVLCVVHLWVIRFLCALHLRDGVWREACLVV